jgi:DHA3 family tetracycline resistance protein-like MFS transporter
VTDAELARAIREHAYLEGDFVLRSGRRSRYYLDKYRFETRPDVLGALGERLAARVAALAPPPDRLAGPELGAVALATAASLASGLPFVIVRKEAKGYGTERQLEGVWREGESVCLVEDVVTTGGASLAAVAAIRPRLPARDETNASAAAAVKEGLRFIRRRVWLWGTLASAAIAYLLFLGPTEVLLPYVVKNELGGSASTLGLVFAAGGVGAVGSAIWMGSRGHPRREVSFIYGTWTLATLAVAGYGIATAAWQLMVACLVFNALETAGTIVWATLKQRHVPSSMLGRVSSLDWLISIGLLPVSFALTAPVAAAIGVRATLVGAAIVGAAVTLGALFLPGMRDLERDADALSAGGFASDWATADRGAPPRLRRARTSRGPGSARALP